MMFWSGLISILCSFVFLCFDQNSQIFFKHNIDWILLGHLSALAVVGISAFWMVTLSRQLIDPTLNSVLLAQEVIFAYVAQTIVTQQMPQYLTFIGAGFVLLSAVCMTLEKWVKSRLPEKHNSFVWFLYNSENIFAGHELINKLKDFLLTWVYWQMNKLLYGNGQC